MPLSGCGVAAVRAPAVSGSASRAAATAAAATMTALDRNGFPSHGAEHAAKAVLELDLGLPTEQLAGARDVGLAHLRIVDWERLEHDVTGRPGDPYDDLCELDERVLGRVADVNRVVLAALREQVQAPDQIVDVAEAPGLRAVAEDGHGHVVERLAHEGRNRAPVVRAHARPIGVEDARDGRVDALLAVIRHGHRLGVALRLVVDATRSDRVDVPPVALGLRVDLRVAVDLARGREQDARTLPLCEAERVVRTVRADLQRMQR